MRRALLMGLLVFSVQASCETINLRQVFSMAIQNSRELSAAAQAKNVAEGGVSLAKTGYLPSLKLEAIDTTGFAGSSKPLGIGGLMGSPYRSGWAYGLVATQNLWDFGQTARSVDAARERVKLSMEAAKLKRLQVMEDALHIYVDCARDTNMLEIWKSLAHESEAIFHEVAKYVKTGQRSIVEQMLVDSQLQDANSQIFDFEARTKISSRRLKEFLGMANAPECPRGIEGLDLQFALATKPPAEHPLISRSKAELAVAQAETEKARSEYRPKLVAVGSVGDMEEARVVAKQDYSAGVGLVFPLFDSDRARRGVERAESLAQQKEYELQAAEQAVTDMNLAIDRLVHSAQAKYDHMKVEQFLASKAFHLAKDRYRSQRGTLVDLREAFRNLSRINTEIIDVQLALLNAKAERELYAGYAPN